MSEPPAQCPPESLAQPNAAGPIRAAAGDSLLSEIVDGFPVLMGTCFSVRESDGSLVHRVLFSDWCRFLHARPAQHCASTGAGGELADGAHLCQEFCGNDASAQAAACSEPVNMECTGGLRLHLVPIHAGGETLGTMCMGFGDPPHDPSQLAQLALRFGVEVAELERCGAAYETRPPFIVELAKQRLAGSARVLGEIVLRHRGELLLRKTIDNLERSNRELEHLAGQHARMWTANTVLERSNRELEQFAYVASHDLQEPLRMVASFTQLLADRYGGQLDQDARDFIAYAVDGATRMKQLIDDLLAYSRVTSAGRSPAVVDTRNAVSLSLRNLEAAVREAGAEVDYGALPQVLADSGQIVQLFQNLVGNAIKFRTPGVPPRVHIEARRAPDEPHQWLFRVADNGIGIDPKFFERVFAIFQRLHSRREYPGTGIGLALCRRIVERYGGRIWIESEPGKGTAFLFTLPEADAQKGEL